MKGKNILVVSVLFFFGLGLCEGQSWVWGSQGKVISLSGYAEGNLVAADYSRNAYLSGYLYDTIFLLQNMMLMGM